MSAPPHVQDEGSEHGLQKHTWPQPQLPHAILIPENAGLREQPGVHVHVNSSKTALQNFPRIHMNIISGLLTFGGQS